MSARPTLVLVFAYGLLVPTAGCLRAEEPKSETFEAKGVKIHYLIAGKGEPVVLLHGLYSSAGINWRLPGVIADLSKDHQVIALDFPGHGQSARPDMKEAYGVQMVEDIVLLLDQHKIGKAHIVGYSMGGAVAVKFAAKHPERVLSLTLGGMGWFREGSDLQKMWGKLPSGKLAPPQAFFDSVGQLAVTEEELKKIDAPTRILVGDKDVCKQLYVVPAQQVRKDWSVVEIKDADHFNCIVKPQFKEELGMWVRKNTR
jgi:pimeloyl-ACP methyl ester carboxylesterase